MGSYLTGLVVALLVIFGLYVSMEVSAGNPLFGQDKLDSHSSAPKGVTPIFAAAKRSLVA